MFVCIKQDLCNLYDTSSDALPTSSGISVEELGGCNSRNFFNKQGTRELVAWESSPLIPS